MDVNKLTHGHCSSRPPHFLRLEMVRSRTGLSRSSIYRLMAGGRFPRPVTLGLNVRAWLEGEIDAWINARVSERDQPHNCNIEAGR